MNPKTPSSGITISARLLISAIVAMAGFFAVTFNSVLQDSRTMRDAVLANQDRTIRAIETFSETEQDHDRKMQQEHAEIRAVASRPRS